MKKFLLSIIGFCLCAICAFSAVGCTTDYGRTTTDTTKVTSNGGSVVEYNGYLYFVNGIGTNDGENNGGTIGSIYKVAVSESGEIAEDAKYEKVVDCLVGYNKGSITIIGDFLYYTTPGTGKNKSGEILYNKTAFMRKNLSNGKTQELYKTEQNSADENVNFAFYKTGENRDSLVLAVYEASSKTLKGFKIANKVETIFSKENVTNAVFSETMGSDTDNAENFVFYTMSAEENAIDTNTNRVYRIGADGTNDTLISDSANLSLEGVKAGKLILTATFGSGSSQFENTYAIDVTSGTVKGDIKIAEENNGKNPYAGSDKYIICRNDYSTLMYVTSDDGKLAVVYLEDNNLMYARYNGKTAPEVMYTIYTFQSSPTLTFIGSYKDSFDNNNGYAVFINKKSSDYILYKIRYTFESEADCLTNREGPEELSTSNIKVESSSSSSSSDSFKFGNLVPKMVDNYIYVFVTDEDKEVLLHRVNFYTPKELNEQNPPAEEPDKEDLEIKEAELIGGSKI